MGTMTITVDDKKEKKFRETVKKTMGTGKGTLGLAVSAAMEKWVESVEQGYFRKRAIERLEKGYSMGKILYKHRAELYDRWKR